MPGAGETLHCEWAEVRVPLVNGRVVEFVEVTRDDIALANELAPEVLGRSLDELPPKKRASCPASSAN